MHSNIAIVDGIRRSSRNEGRRFVPVVLAMLLTVWSGKAAVAQAVDGAGQGQLGGEIFAAQPTVGTFCTIKGQEENTLQGLGLVVGLNGTGDKDFAPALRMIATLMDRLGENFNPTTVMRELRGAKNVAVVLVTCRVPGHGAREGERLDCTVASMGSSQSLVGGHLVVAPLVGPAPPQTPYEDLPVFAVADGPITVADENLATKGRVHRGARLVREFFNPFISETGEVTLVVRDQFKSFAMAQRIADAVKADQNLELDPTDDTAAMALDQGNVVVRLTDVAKENPVVFVADLLEVPIAVIPTQRRVWIDEQSQTINYSGDVRIRPCAINQRNIAVTAQMAGGGTWVGMDTENPNNPRLAKLLEALNAVRVPTKDQIEILKTISKNGNLLGELVVE